MLRGVDQQRAPAAADVEQPLAGLEAQLGADQLELALLRGFQRLAGVGEVRARVDHARAEEKPVEVVRDVVVVLDRGLVARERVQPALALGLDRGHGQAPEHARPGEPDGGGEQGRAVAGGELDAVEVAAQADDRLQVGVALDVERTGHPGAREPDLVRGVEQVGDRVGRADLDDGGAAFEDAAVPESEGHGEVGQPAGDEGLAGGMREPRPATRHPEDRRACLHRQSI